MSLPIPIIETHGSHLQVGEQIGIAARDALREMHAETRDEYGAKWDTLLAMSAAFVAQTGQRLPNVMQELRGCAQGAGIPFDDLFLMSIEELLYEEVRGMGTEAGESPRKNKGCSDLAAAPPATRDGHVWLAHNNDLGKSALKHLFVTHFRVEGEPEILAVTVGGIFISIGLNNAGLSLTGNQLNSNDSRVGIPRLLLVRDILAQTTLDTALASALLTERASSYNNIIASRQGRIVNAEGSATSAALTWSDENGGTLAHTNHYLDPKMLHFESDERHISMSASRCARAFDYATKYRGQIGYDVCARFVRDHVYAPWSVCKHAGQSVTVFSALIDLTELKLWLTRGNPCQSDFTLYTFSDKSPLNYTHKNSAVL
jgi:isopenicillin-N N-acyltransferase-like protein